MQPLSGDRSAGAEVADDPGAEQAYEVVQVMHQQGVACVPRQAC